MFDRRIVIELTTPLSVDESLIDSALDRSGTNWDNVDIVLPQSILCLVTLISEATKKLEVVRVNKPGIDYFLANAPRNIADADTNWRLIRSRLPNMIKRVSAL